MSSEWCEHAYPPNADCPWCEIAVLRQQVESLRAALERHEADALRFWGKDDEGVYAALKEPSHDA